mmetsp:Transcript_13229/g.18317  ORF Transcript_13229/g.18317 Transcript_13229/m.18317 type:complete len:202 (+) Transcript_13229:1052-1657(+)
MTPTIARNVAALLGVCIGLHIQHFLLQLRSPCICSPQQSLGSTSSSVSLAWPDSSMRCMVLSLGRMNASALFDGVSKVKSSLLSPSKSSIGSFGIGDMGDPSPLLSVCFRSINDNSFLTEFNDTTLFTPVALLSKEISEEATCTPSFATAFSLIRFLCSASRFAWSACTSLSHSTQRYPAQSLQSQAASASRHVPHLTIQF